MVVQTLVIMGSVFSSPNTISEDLVFSYDTTNNDTFPLSIIDNIKYYKYVPENVTTKVIVFCHSSEMTTSSRTVHPLSSLADRSKATLYMLEHPSYGENKNLSTPTIDSCIQALETLIQQIVSERHNYQDIYVMGNSIGIGGFKICV